MVKVKYVLDSITYEEMVENLNNRIDYYEIAMSLLYTGEEYQRNYINSCMKFLKGKQQKEAIKNFIDVEMMVGRLGV
jgi:hypothetical protein